MSNHARIEEVSDSDSDPPEVDISEFNPSSLMQPSDVPSSGMALRPQMEDARAEQSAQRDASKHWQCLYPIYFDASKTRTEGRRVGQEHAVENPLAREIVDAAASLGLKVVFEPGKIHPKDWSNPGRVRVLLKDKDGTKKSNIVDNKHHLYNLIAGYLKKHPADERTPLRLPIAGLPPQNEPLPAPAVPKGWKINTILPLHSPAVSGGGVSENLKDLLPPGMAGMPGMPGMPGLGGEAAESSGGEGKKSKSKKKAKG